MPKGDRIPLAALATINAALAEQAQRKPPVPLGLLLKKHKKQFKIIKERAGSLAPALTCLEAQHCPVPIAVLDAVLTCKNISDITDPALQQVLSQAAADLLSAALKTCAQTAQDAHSRDIRASVAYLYDTIEAMREAGWGWVAIAAHISQVEVDGKTYGIKAGSLERYFRMLRQEKVQPTAATAVNEPRAGLLPEHTDQAIDALFES